MPGLVIEGEVLIEAPVDVVWRTVAEPDQMSQWFADRVELVVEPGAHGHMQFGDQGGPVVVETVDPPARFSFRWNHPRGEEPVAGQLDARGVHADTGRQRADPCFGYPKAARACAGTGPTRRAALCRRAPGRLDRVPGPSRQRARGASVRMTAPTEDELWSAIADPSRRRVLDLLVSHGDVSASWLRRPRALLPPGGLQTPGRARTGRAGQPAQAGPGGSLPGPSRPSRPGRPGHG